MSSSVAGQAAVLSATAQNFTAVMKAAKGGDTIRLIGDFGVTRVKDRTFTTTLRIDATRARFSDSMVLSNVHGVTITGGTFGTSSGRTSYNQAIVVGNGSNIAIDRAKFVGSGIGTGIGVSNARNVTITNSTFDRLKAGVMMSSVTGGRVQGNVSRNSSSDGFAIAGSHNILLKGNSCSAGQIGPGFHPDCIQLWSIKGQPVQSDITITENSVTGYTQGFTSFTPANGGGLRIAITNNRVDTSMPQGIACYACVDSVITGNVITTAAGATHKTRLNIVGGGNNIVENNSIAEFNRNPDPTRRTITATTSSAFTSFEATASEGEGFTASAGRSAIDDATATGEAAISAVPEPASWLLMVGGFGLIGTMMRRRARKSVVVVA